MTSEEADAARYVDVDTCLLELRALHAEWDRAVPEPGSDDHQRLVTAISDATRSLIRAERAHKELTADRGGEGRILGRLTRSRRPVERTTQGESR